MKTLLLLPSTWDLTKDASGNIAVASDPYSLAQNAASAIKLFQGEQWYNTTLGVPYFQQIFSKAPNIALMKAKFVAAALTVPGVTAAVVFITLITDRGVRGQVQVTAADGTVSVAAFAPGIPPSPPSPPSGNTASTDFSDPSNSQFLPGL